MGKTAKDPGWAKCPECDKRIKEENLARHMRRVHKVADVERFKPARPAPPGPFPLKNLLAVLAVVAILVFVAVFVYTRPVQVPSTPSFSIDPTSYDYGIIPPQKVSTNMTISNYGEGTLEVFNISSSCDCTTATLIYQNTTSPTFKKSDNPEYKAKIAPGGRATLVVTLDPSMFSASGPIYRFVYLKTNDADRKDVSITLTATIRR